MKREIATNLDDLVGKYSQPQEADTFVITLPGGEEITCKVPDRVGFIEGFKTELTKFWKLIEGKKVPPAWEPYLPLTWDEAVAVVSLYYNSTEPTKFSQFQALRMSTAGGGYILLNLQDQMEKYHHKISYEKFVEEVEEGKETSSEMTLEDGS
jgi:hypothetical protein